MREAKALGSGRLVHVRNIVDLASTLVNEVGLLTRDWVIVHVDVLLRKG